MLGLENQIRILVPPSLIISVLLADRRIGLDETPLLNSKTKDESLPSSNLFDVIDTFSPHMKTEKKPIPYFPVDLNPFDSRPGNSSCIKSVPQNDSPKSKKGPVKTF